jgi:hypothetical protein
MITCQLSETPNVQAISVEDPTNCNRCNASLERGWSFLQRTDGTEYLCFECSDKEVIKQYLETHILTSKLSMIAALAEVKLEVGKTPKIDIETIAKVIDSFNRIRNEYKIWEQEVWFGGLQKQVRDATYTGMSMEFLSGRVLTMSSAGRTLFTIDSAVLDCSLTLITAEDSDDHVMGLQSICATEEQAIRLLKESRSAFKDGLTFHQDKGIGFGF